MLESDKTEIWKDIYGYNGDYKVSNYGRIKSLKNKNELILKTTINKNTGYEYVGLCKDGNVTTTTVHRIVAEAFIPNLYKLPCVNHKDENKTNNCVKNLEWCTYEYNLNYGTHTERAKETRKNNGSDRFIIDYSLKNRDYISQRMRDVLGIDIAKINKETGEIIEVYETISDAEKNNKCKHIGDCINNKRNESGGFIWKSIKDINDNPSCILETINRIKILKTKCRKIMNKGKVILQLDLNDNIINKFNSIKEASESTNCKSYSISDCLHGRQKTSGGYKWRFE